MKIVYLLITAMVVCACSNESEDEVRPTVGEEIASDYNSALDKAQNVEDEVMEQKRKLDEALEDIE